MTEQKRPTGRRRENNRDARRRKRAERKMERRQAQLAAGGLSRYARKVAYCLAHGVAAVDVPSPKPWK